MFVVAGPPWSLSGPYAPPAMHTRVASQVGGPAVQMSPKSGLKAPYCGVQVPFEKLSSSGRCLGSRYATPAAVHRAVVAQEMPAICVKSSVVPPGIGAAVVVHDPPL